MLSLPNLAHVGVLAALAKAVVAVPAPEPQTAILSNPSSMSSFQPSLSFSQLPAQVSLGPIPPPECEPNFLCVDGANKCGKWGGCWDTCKPWMSPIEPSCEPSSTLAPVLSAIGTPSIQPTVCEPAIMCVAGVNECGNTFTGCYDTCTPSLKPTAPPCLAAVETPSIPLVTPADTVAPLATPIGIPAITPVVTPAPASIITGLPVDNCRTRTVCVDAIDACGQNCVPDCKPWAIATPLCSLSSMTQMTIVTLPPSTTTALANMSLPSLPMENCSSQTVCWDGVNECGQMFGGCFPACTPWPTFSKPPCPSTEARSTTFSTITTPPIINDTGTVTGSNCFSRTVCWEAVNNCGIPYGGCFPDCRPWPTFTRPACPSSTTSPIIP